MPPWSSKSSCSISLAMPDSPAKKKTLGLPDKQEAATLRHPLRKPVRGGGARQRKVPAKVRQEKPAEAPGLLPPSSEKPARAARRESKPVTASASNGRSAGRPARPERESVPLFVPKADAGLQSGAPTGAVRVSKLMAERGICSRREADAYIEHGLVFVDGQRISELGTRADPSATITLDKAAKANQQRQMTVLLHKPVGYVSGQPEPGFKPAVLLILPENQFRVPGTPAFQPGHLKGLAPAGRLDIDSTGLLVLTQNGRIARQLIGEDSKVEKEYLVRVEGHLDEQSLGLLNHGLSLDGKRLKPAKVEWLNTEQLRFVLNEGRKRQIRRMCELVGLRVVGLKRVRIGGVALGDLPPGQWRYLREDEGF